MKKIVSTIFSYKIPFLFLNEYTHSIYLHKQILTKKSTEIACCWDVSHIGFFVCFYGFFFNYIIFNAKAILVQVYYWKYFLKYTES